MHIQRPYDRHFDDAYARIEKVVQESLADLPLEIVLSALMTNVAFRLKKLTDEDKWAVFNIGTFCFHNELELRSFEVQGPDKDFFETMRRYDELHL